jgi:hypothetical protein
MFPEKIGRYEILAELGRGGWPRSIKHMTRTQREPAVEVLPATFINELPSGHASSAKAIAALNLGIVAVYDGEENGQPYLVMRCTRRLLISETEGPIGLTESSVITRLSGALDYVHARAHPCDRSLPISCSTNSPARTISTLASPGLQEASVALTGDRMIGTPA